MKHCKDCKWYQQAREYEEFYCTHIKNQKVDIVDGTLSYKYSTYAVREGWWWVALIVGNCGKTGRWFEERGIEVDLKKFMDDKKLKKYDPHEGFDFGECDKDE